MNDILHLLDRKKSPVLAFVTGLAARFSSRGRFGGLGRSPGWIRRWRPVGVPGILGESLFEMLDSLFLLLDDRLEPLHRGSKLLDGGFQLCDPSIASRAALAPRCGRRKSFRFSHALFIGSAGVRLYRNGRKTVSGWFLKIKRNPAMQLNGYLF